MVNIMMVGVARVGRWLAAGQPFLQKIDPVTRAKVLSALAALIILGFSMMLLAWLGARATRRYMNRGVHTGRSGRGAVPSDDDWASKPLAPRATDGLPEDREHDS